MDTFLDDVTAGLSEAQKILPCKYFYDERGSELFEAICEVEEYYVTRADLEITRTYASEFAAQVGPRARIVEFGSGSGIKTQILLDALEDPAAYIPVEISSAALDASAARLRTRYPNLEIAPLCADYTLPITIAPSDARTVVYFPGSTIGNFHPPEAVRFLGRMRSLAGEGGALLIGVDREKDAGVLERAYDDADGVTAAFNMNLLERINRELGANFDLAQFRHRAVYDVEKHRIEMHLVSCCNQAVTIGNRTFDFVAEEFIRSEVSYKYSVERFTSIATAAELKVVETWSDAKGAFSTHYLEPC